MIKIHLDAKDLGQIRFGISPLAELVTGLRAVLYPLPHSVHAPWVETSQAFLEKLDIEPFTALVRPKGYMPDFLTPPPTDGTPGFEAELQRLLAMPCEQARLEVSRVMNGSPPDETLTAFLEHPRNSLEHLAVRRMLRCPRTPLLCPVRCQHP
jgi:hypothetical protein